MEHFVLILAAGEGSRLKSEIPKQFLEINGTPMLMHSILAFKKADPNAKIYIALSKKNEFYWDQICKKYNFNIEHHTYIGGNQRSETVFLGLQQIYTAISSGKNKKINKTELSSEINSMVSIHDAARPFIDPPFILELLHAAKSHGSAVPTLNLKSALRKISHESSMNSLGENREQYFITQTPQVFSFEKIYKSYCQLDKKNITLDNKLSNESRKQVFDDASVYDLLHDKSPIHILNGREYNIKITTELDYFVSEHIYDFFKNLK